MLDRIIDEIVASLGAWRVDMGLLTTNRDRDPATLPSTPPSPGQSMRRAPITNMSGVGNNTHTKPSIEDPEYFQRILHSRYPEHMLHCPQTSLYPIFLFFMERWEERRAARQQALTSVAASATTTPTVESGTE